MIISLRTQWTLDNTPIHLLLLYRQKFHIRCLAYLMLLLLTSKRNFVYGSSSNLAIEWSEECKLLDCGKLFSTLTFVVLVARTALLFCSTFWPGAGYPHLLSSLSRKMRLKCCFLLELFGNKNCFYCLFLLPLENA